MTKKINTKSAIKAMYDLISGIDERHKNMKEVACMDDGTYVYMNEYAIFHLNDYYDTGFPLVPFEASHLKPFFHFLDAAKKMAVTCIDPPTPERIKEMIQPERDTIQYCPDYYISKKLMLTAWAVLGEYMLMALPENPLHPVYLESARGAACIYPKRPPKKSYEREIRS